MTVHLLSAHGGFKRRQRQRAMIKGQCLVAMISFGFLSTILSFVSARHTKVRDAQTKYLSGLTAHLLCSSDKQAVLRVTIFPHDF